MSQARENSAASPVRGLKRELARTISQADRRGCFRGFFFRARGKGCGSLLSRIERLEEMIHQPAPRPRNRDWVKRELARNGCFEKSPADTRTAETPAINTPDIASSGGYRTVCVRSCDGYFFPLGFSQSKSEFARDRETCKGIYGDAAADLYFYPSDGSPDQMISLDGNAYAKENFAFAYQREFRPACQSELQRGVGRMRDAFLTVASREAFRRFKLIPVPIPRPTGDERLIAEDERMSTPPKTVSRILPPFPVYASMAPQAVAAHEKKEPDLLGAILEWISPAAKADPNH
jgi:hypothetical protein